MSASRGVSLQAIQDLRHMIATVVALCDVAIYGPRGESEVALRKLPSALCRLTVLMARVVAALASEGIS
jgi:hypothetical protein